jgi:DNA-binding LacI/PurR family transcriptional regulator
MTGAGVLAPRDLAALDLVTEDSVPLATEVVQRLLRDGVEVDGIVCASDSLALGALMATDSRIPVVGFDDTPVADAIGLSSVRQPVETIAGAVLRLLRTPTVDGAPASAHELVQPTVVWRDGRTRLSPV